MNDARPASHPTAHYELRVDGHLGGHWSTWFGGMTLTHCDDGTTVLRGPVTDQAELHGLLAKVRDLGATLLSVHAVDPQRGPSFLSTVPAASPAPNSGS